MRVSINITFKFIELCAVKLEMDDFKLISVIQYFKHYYRFKKENYMALS